MEITKEFFEASIYTATSASADVFDGISNDIEAAKYELNTKLIPSTLAEKDIPNDIMIEMQRFVCFTAFYNAIPTLDLVLTSTGFGIVSNQNVAPASKDRVDALRTNLRQRSDDSLDKIINMLIVSNLRWGESANAAIAVGSLFFSAAQMRDYAGKADAYRIDLINARVLITEAEDIIRHDLSNAQFERILTAIRTNALTDNETILLHYMRTAVGMWIAQKLLAFKRALTSMMNFVEDNINDFTAYKDSPTYNANHFEFYGNAKDDSCFFFG